MAVEKYTIVGNATDADGDKYEVAATFTLTAASTPVQPTPPIPPATPKASAENTYIIVGASLTADDLTVWTITPDGRVAAKGTPDLTTAGAVGVLKRAGIWHTNNQGAWYFLSKPGAQWPWTGPSTDPRVVAPKPPTSGALGVSTAGFTRGGKPISMRGLNAGPNEILTGWDGARREYPGITHWRVNCNSNNDETADIGRIVSMCAALGIICILEDHGGQTRNVGWYQRMTNAYKAGPGNVILEMPNEPGGDVAGDQTAIIQAIRAAGWTGLIGLQPTGGYNFAPVSTVVNNVGGPANLFVTPHIYYSGPDPNGPQQYLDAQIGASKERGMFCIIDEFGDAMDGWHRDAQGSAVISSIMNGNIAGKCGATFWAMNNGNHPDGTDSAFLDTKGNALTPVGVRLKPWLA